MIKDEESFGTDDLKSLLDIIAKIKRENTDNRTQNYKKLDKLANIT